MNAVRTLLIAGFVAIGAAALFVHTGMFEVAADVPHSQWLVPVLETARDRAIAVRANGIHAPVLDEPARIGRGALEYAEMCAGCHGAPGEGPSELRQGLYPAPPALTERSRASPGEMFWVVKHGIKMTAMPAWGATHDDERIWDMVAFVQKLPGLTPQQYQAMVSPHGTDESHEKVPHHHHEGGAHNRHSHAHPQR